MKYTEEEEKGIRRERAIAKTGERWQSKEWSNVWDMYQLPKYCRNAAKLDDITNYYLFAQSNEEGLRIEAKINDRQENHLVQLIKSAIWEIPMEKLRTIGDLSLFMGRIKALDKLQDDFETMYFDTPEKDRTELE